MKSFFILVLFFVCLVLIMLCYNLAQQTIKLPIADAYNSGITGRIARSNVDFNVEQKYQDVLPHKIPFFIGNITKSNMSRHNTVMLDKKYFENMFWFKRLLYNLLYDLHYSHNEYRLFNWKNRYIKSSEHFNTSMDFKLHSEKDKVLYNNLDKIVEDCQKDFCYFKKNDIESSVPNFKYLFNFESTKDANFISMIILPIKKHQNIQQDYIFIAFVNGEKVYNINYENSNLIQDIDNALKDYSWL